jgi:hypothetical protein
MSILSNTGCKLQALTKTVHAQCRDCDSVVRYPVTLLNPKHTCQQYSPNIWAEYTELAHRYIKHGKFTGFLKSYYRKKVMFHNRQMHARLSSQAFMGSSHIVMSGNALLGAPPKAQMQLGVELCQQNVGLLQSRPHGRIQLWGPTSANHDLNDLAMLKLQHPLVRTTPMILETVQRNLEEHLTRKSFRRRHASTTNASSNHTRSNLTRENTSRRTSCKNRRPAVSACPAQSVSASHKPGQ